MPYFHLIKLSASREFQFLRSRAPLFCVILNTYISVTRVFYDHIAHHQRRRRKVNDLVERLLMIPLVDEILMQGQVSEVRDINKYKYTEISHTIDGQVYSVVIRENKQKAILLSCFIKRLPKTPKNLS